MTTKEKRKGLHKALLATADKYMHPYREMFFYKESCPVCLFVGYCYPCPLNFVKHDRGTGFGCIHHKDYAMLRLEIDSNAVFKKLPSGITRKCYAKRKPLPHMIERAGVLKLAAQAIMKLTNEEITNNTFDKIHEIVR